MGLRYSHFMFDVLVYLYENYWRPDACPDHAQLSKKLSAVGFESEEIEDALSWLDGLTHLEFPCVEPRHADAMRLYSAAEQEHLGTASIAFISFLESAGVLSPVLREQVIDRAMATGSTPITLEDLKIIVLMIFWNAGLEPDTLVLDELFVDATDRIIH